MLILSRFSAYTALFFYSQLDKVLQKAHLVVLKRVYIHLVILSYVAVWPWPATKGHMVALSSLPSLWWEGEWKEKRQKVMGRDKDSLTEQQMKQTVTTAILTRRIYKTNSEVRRATLTAHVLPSLNSLPPSQFPPPAPSMTAHDIKYPALFGQFGSGCVPSWLLMRFNPVLAKPRTN